ncbi:50S ribosome-binding GTPase [Candidatus Woesearchaeota archaeon]|nr:50S ribosome-binding GTPase [Candidatus Woesearchaeota archaeon]
MAFNDLPPIEKLDVYLDSAFKRARTNARKYVLKESEKSALARTRTLALLKIGTIKDYLSESFRSIIAKYPNFDNLTEFYTQLLKVLLDYKKLKKSLGSIDWFVKQLALLSKKYGRLVRSATSANQVDMFMGEYYGRVSSSLKQIKGELQSLHGARQQLREFPSIKEGLFTVCIAGFPNVGKSTLLSKLTPAKPEINRYAFTTKKLNMGYSADDGKKIQFIDTPGALNRLEKMNEIEKQAFLAMKYVGDVLVYVFDLTEDSYPLADQQKLFKRLKDLDKTMLCYLSKTDILDSSVITDFQETFVKKKIPLYLNQEQLLAALYLLHKDFFA